MQMNAQLLASIIQIQLAFSTVSHWRGWGGVGVYPTYKSMGSGN